MALSHKLRSSHAGRTLASLLCCLCLLVPLASCDFGTASNPLQLIPLDLGIPANAMNSPVVGQLAGNTRLRVRVTFKIDPNLLQQAQQQQVQPGQPSHTEQWANKIGISDSTYQKIKSFFNLGGIELNLSKLRTQLAINAKASTLGRVLQTQFVVHNYNGRTFFTPDKARPPKAPQFFVNSIDAITGLDNYSPSPSHQAGMQIQTPAQPQRSAQDCSPQDQTLLPKEVAHAYGFDQLWNRGWHGENMTVNLVEIDGAYTSDIQNYFDCINFQGHFSTVDVDGRPQEALGESTLDIQMVAGLDRSSNIVVYQTDGSNANDNIWVNVNDELQKLLDNNVNNGNSGNVVSISLGAAEQDMTGADMRAIDSSIQQLVRVEHMLVFVASGDCGAFTSGQYGHLAVSFPASDPWAISVGGTILQIDQNRSRANEVVWSSDSPSNKCQNDWGSGGGNSGNFSRTNWQSAPGVNNHYAHGKRQVPDVSAVAYALAVYFNGQWSAVGGTSAAAPIWAAGLALINQGLLQQKHKFNPSPAILYTAATNSGGKHPFYDVTDGNNLYYQATPGWDYATGLGTPNLPDLYQTIYNQIK